MINTREIIDWIKKEEHNNISLHAYDPRYKKFITHTNNQSNIFLVYISKDNHLFPILNKKLKLISTKANSGGAQNLLKYMTDLKWNNHHDEKNIKLIESDYDIIENKKKEYVMILPEDMKMYRTIQIYTQINNYYI